MWRRRKRRRRSRFAPGCRCFSSCPLLPLPPFFFIFFLPFLLFLSLLPVTSLFCFLFCNLLYSTPTLMHCKMHSQNSIHAVHNVTGVGEVSVFVTSTVENWDAVSQPESHPLSTSCCSPFFLPGEADTLGFFLNLYQL